MEDGTKRAARLGEAVGELDAQAWRVGARVRYLETLEGRVNALHAPSVEIDGKLKEQLDRRTELGALKAQCDAVAAQMLDAHQKVEGVAALQAKVLPMENSLAILQDRLAKAQAALAAVRRDDVALGEQEARLTGLVESGRSLAAESEERLRQVQSLTEQLERAGAARDELLGDLARVETRQATVTDVQIKANQIANLLEDVSVNLEMVGEQKAVVHHVAERLARREFVMREGQGTLQTLEHERELAERNEKNIKQLRGPAARGDKGGAKSA